VWFRAKANCEEELREPSGRSKVVHNHTSLSFRARVGVFFQAADNVFSALGNRELSARYTRILLRALKPRLVIPRESSGDSLGLVLSCCSNLAVSGRIFTGPDQGYCSRTFRSAGVGGLLSALVVRALGISARCSARAYVSSGINGDIEPTATSGVVVSFHDSMRSFVEDKCLVYLSTVCELDSSSSRAG
jgi:hypothetical protein